MGKAQSLDVFLQSRRNLSLISPEIISLKFRLELFIDILDFTERFISLYSCISTWMLYEFILFFKGGAMKGKNDLLGCVSDVTARLIFKGKSLWWLIYLYINTFIRRSLLSWCLSSSSLKSWNRDWVLLLTLLTTALVVMRDECMRRWSHVLTTGGSYWWWWKWVRLDRQPPPFPLEFLNYHWNLTAMSTFAPKTGCPMCSIVASASHVSPNSPRSPSFPPGSTQAEVLWRDDNFTAYREKANPVSSKGHIIIAFKWEFILNQCVEVVSHIHHST